MHERRRMTTPLRAAVFAVAALGALACHPVRTVPVPPAQPVVNVPNRHVVRSESLRTIMRRLESLAHDRIQSELALDKQRMRHADALAAAASELARTAPGITGAEEYSNLDAAARARFGEYAKALEREASTLQRYASEGRLSEIAAQYERLTHACAGCHSLYRGR